MWCKDVHPSLEGGVCYLTRNHTSASMYLLNFTETGSKKVQTVIMMLHYMIMGINYYSNKGIAHCDISPDNFIAKMYAPNIDVTGYQLTGYLGKHKMVDNEYHPSTNPCNHQGNKKYFSPRRARQYIAEIVMQNDSINDDWRHGAAYIASGIDSEYNEGYQHVSPSQQDDLMSALLVFHEICYPKKTFESYFQSLINSNKIQPMEEDYCSQDFDFFHLYGIDKDVCLRSLFYNSVIPQYDYDVKYFHEFFNFKDKCEFLDEYTYAYEDEELREHMGLLHMAAKGELSIEMMTEMMGYS
eukprot:GHVR01109682.1.p1 GENE.GHVR01109682.1~~GHVR01109682.1.p1  ORF type:complete len:298 (-),score=39.51 GHVR01109682.1:725-1618(-)